MDLNLDIANSICTIIAAGFIEANRSIETIKKIKKEASMITCFSYQKNDEVQHMLLKKILACYDISISFKNEKDASVPEMTDDQRRYTLPLIIARSTTLYDSEAMKGIADDFRTALLGMETSVNMEKLRKLPGAYISGLASLSNIKFSGPSYLFLYTPIYRRDIDTAVKTSYENANEITNNLVAFLERKCKGSETIRQLHFNPEYSVRYNSGTYVSGQLFASCHGMVMAIYDFLDTAGRDICVELSLGSDTCKVASCLPCSLFMTANNVPASSTHLGRGDNWNYPKIMSSHYRTKFWRDTLMKIYIYGVDKLRNASNNFDGEDNLLEAINFVMEKGIGNIHQIFLESLTYEGPFIDKINRSLKRRPA